MSEQFRTVFETLKGILERQSAHLTVAEDSPTKYCLEAPVGPKTLENWNGEVRRPSIPVAWVEIGKNYVAYHLMPCGSPKVIAGISKSLMAHMQGRTCFAFKTTDEALFTELGRLTERGVTAFRKSGFIA